MLFKIIEKVEDSMITCSLAVTTPRTECLEEFIEYISEELKKSTNNQVYINKTTWAKSRGIHRRTLTRYINQFIASNNFIEIPYDDERYDKAKGKRLCCLQIVQVPLKYQKLLEIEIEELIEKFNAKIRKP